MNLENFREEFVQDRIADHPMIYVKNVSRISDLQYKLMKRNQIRGLADFRKIKINGEVFFVYLPGKKMILDEARRTLDPEAYSVVICSLLSCLNDIYDSGYLKIENVVLDSRSIYIEKNSGSASITYLPVDLPALAEEEIAERQIKAFLGAIIAGSFLRNTFEGQVCINFLKEKDLGFAETVRFVRDAFAHMKKDNDRINSIVMLESKSVLHSIRIAVTEGRYTIGKYFQTTNGKVERIDTVSQEHCEIIKEDSGIYVVDLNSTNGTFLNGKQLLQGKKQELHDGDVLGVANIPFQVKIKGIGC